MIVLINDYNKSNYITNILIEKGISFHYSVQFSYYDFNKNEFSEVLKSYFCYKIKKKISKEIINKIKAIDEHIILLFSN